MAGYDDITCGVFTLNTSSTKEEDDSVYDKIDISETVIIPNNFELQDHMKWHVKIEKQETSTILDNIKEELPYSEGQCNINDNVNIEERIGATDVKIEFDNGLLYCECCQAYYEDYCIECGMLVNILNRDAPYNSDNKTQDELPNGILEIQHLFGQCGILALKVIPEGVKFGPFTGLCRTASAWRIKGGKFVVDKDRLQHLNWMQYINSARNTFEGNLIALQCEDYLYYRSTRQIQPGEELLVYFGEEFEDSLNGNVEVDFIPNAEYIIKDVFACTFCSLGFSSKSYLAKHKTICLGDADLLQCPCCKIHFGRKEYLEHHFVYCSERNVRKRGAVTLSNQMTAVNGRKTRRSPLYKCEQCKYRVKYKADLKKHTNNQHYKVKKSKCEISYRRFETKEYLRLHVENTHISVGGNQDPAHSGRDDVNTHIKEEQSNSQGESKIFKCPLCGLRTQHRQSLASHMKTKHSKEFNYKCGSCEFKTNRKDYFEGHVKTKHLKEFSFTFICDSCEFKTNRKDYFERHIKSKHLKEFDFRCDSCEFKTNRKDQLERHIKSIHLKEFDLKCDSCEFKTSRKDRLESHVKTKHLNEFDFKCDSCEFKTNRKDLLEGHVKSKHLKEFDFRCDSCEYRTNHKQHLEYHIKTKHSKEFNYKCDSCEFKTNRKDQLERHIKSMHLKEFDLKCDSCEFKTSRKDRLESHVKTKHLYEFDFKCDSCEFKTNRKDLLEGHVKTTHLKEFDFKCGSRQYGTNRKYNLELHIKRKHLNEIDYKKAMAHAD